MSKTLLVTGAAGFIGSAFVRKALDKKYKIIILDAMTYAGHMGNIESLLKTGLCEFFRGDIGDTPLVNELLNKYQPSGIINFAAESHVDNSITGPLAFIQTNIVGTFHLLQTCRSYYEKLQGPQQKEFRFVHVSTDEVFGTLGETGKFTEETAYAPNSPYSASKASSDFLARAWFHTYKFPVVITNCSNNYGPRQFPEKLIPRMITQAVEDQKLPVYGTGTNIRDWIHVEDHAEGVLLAYEKGELGESYCFGGNSERTNLDVVQKICEILDRKKPRANGKSYKELISFVEDRKGHDFRYAIDDAKAQKRLGFDRKYKTFEQGLEETVSWYLENKVWLKSLEGKKKS